MLREIEFENFRILRKAKLPLGPLTILVGANSSGKSTALLGLRRLRETFTGKGWLRPGDRSSIAPHALALVRVSGSIEIAGATTVVRTTLDEQNSVTREPRQKLPSGPNSAQQLLAGVREFRLDSTTVSAPSGLVSEVELGERGEHLAIVLDRMRDRDPERFAGLNLAVREWFEEFDQVLFDTPGPGARSLALRRTSGRVPIPAANLAEGTLFALCILTLSRLAEPPTIACFEEPERGIHPRLLPKVKDALVRLAYPESVGETRQATQVIATTHSPHFLDLFKDMPECIVIAERKGDEAVFKRLVDIEHWEEIVANAPLGDVWYSGVLGGIPAR